MLRQITVTPAQAGARDSAQPARAPQMTLSRPVSLAGRGLFHGARANVRLLPAAEHQGIVFRRVDLPGKPEVPARVEFVVAAPRRTVLACGAARVETVEHLMAALAGLQIDNCLVEIDAAEIPALDGSAMPFCEAILQAGADAQTAPREVRRLVEPHAAAGDGGERIEVTPRFGDSLSVCYQLDYGADSPVPAGSFSVDVTPQHFLSQIAAARTFVHQDEIESLQQMGFGKHLTSQDIVVFGQDGSIQENAMRWPDEPVRHKILDCIGDLALCGVPFAAQVIAHRSGHKLNHVMASVVSMISGRGITWRRAA